MKTGFKPSALWPGQKIFLAAMLFIALAVMAAAVYFFAKQNKWLRQEFTKQVESIQLRDDIEKVNLYLKDAESGMRGYALTGDRHFIESVDSDHSSVRTIYERMQQRKPGLNNKAFDSLFLKSENLVKRRIDFNKQIIAFCDGNNWKEARALIETRQGLNLSDSMRQLQAIMIGRMDKHLQTSQSEFQKAKNKNNNFAYSGIGAFLLIIAFVVFLLENEIKRTRKMGEDLQTRKDIFKLSFNSIEEGLICTNDEGRVNYMNPAAEKLTGWKWQEAKNEPLQKVFNVVNEETGDLFENLVARILKDKKKYDWENNTLLQARHMGKYVISNKGTPIIDEEGNITGVVLVFSDITERKKAEKKLLENEKQYKELIQNLPVAVYTCDGEGFVKLYNKPAVALWGREPVAGKDLWCDSWKISNSDGTDLPIDKTPLAIALQKEGLVEPTEIIVQRPDGSLSHVLPYSSQFINAKGQIAGTVNMLIDITDKKEKEILIKQSEEKYRALIDQASDAIFVNDQQLNIIEVNESASLLLGYTKEELLTMNVKDLYTEAELLKRPVMQKELLHGQRTRIERNVLHKDGSLIPIEITARMVSDGRIIVMIRDITERKKAELERERLTSILENTSDFVGIANIDLKILYANKAAMKAIQVESEEELSRYNLSDGVPTLVKESFFKNMVPQILEHGTWQGETTWLAKDGTEIPVSQAILLHKNEKGESLYFSIIARDITERRKAEEEIKKEKDLLEHVINSLPAVFFLCDGKANLLRWNKNLEIVSGYEASEIASMHLLDFFDVDEKVLIAEKIVDVFSDGDGNVDAIFLTKDNKKIPYYFTGFRIKVDGHVQLLGIGIDLTNRKKAEEALARSENHLRTIIQAEPECVKLLDINGMLQEMNPAGLAMIEADSLQEVKGKSVFDVIAEPYQKDFRNLTKDVFKGKTGILEFEIIGLKGTHRWLETHAVPLTSTDGKVISLLGVTREITGRKKAEEEISKAMERYDILSRATSDTVWDWDITNDHIFYNDGIKKRFGYNVTELTNVDGWWQQNILPDDLPAIRELLADAFEKKLTTLKMEYRFRSADRSYKHVFDRAYIIYSELGTPTRMIGAMQDVTYQKEEEMRISKAVIDAQETERGYIGAELHDNVNQLLATSSLYLGMAKKEGTDFKESYQLIVESQEFINEAMQELRKLSHEMAPAVFDDSSLQDDFESLLDSFNADKRFNIDLQFDLQGRSPGFDVQLNLYRILQEQTKNISKYSQASEIKISVMANENSVSMRIADNGKGFDVKKTRKGIGLSNMRRRAEAQNGKFVLKSEPGNGCEVVVQFPLMG